MRAGLKLRVDPRVHVRDAFAISLWTYYEPVRSEVALVAGLIHRCRGLGWAMFSAWRWRRDDQIPDRDHWRVEGLNRVRAALDRCGLG